jgi:hypothetical protein
MFLAVIGALVQAMDVGMTSDMTGFDRFGHTSYLPSSPTVSS